MEQNYNPFENTQTFRQLPNITKKNTFATASVCLSVGAIISCSFFYCAYPLGALAILFALLSRGDQMHMNTKAKWGFFLGIAAIFLSTVITIGAVCIVLGEYGSFENALMEYCQLYGLDFETEFGILFP